MVTGGGQVLLSLQPKLGGVLGAIVAVDTILMSEPHTQSQPPSDSSQDSQLCTLIDNKAVISRICKWSTKGIANVLDSEHDLLQAASKTIADVHLLTMIPQHVESHQDKETDFISLLR